MVSCATGCNPLIYKGYGCYCGFLGSGYAVDGIDRCCQLHDWCYDNANCPMFLEYFVPYYWKCYRNTPLCGKHSCFIISVLLKRYFPAVSEEQWGGRRSCAYKLCECDRILSECFSRYPCPSSRALCRSSTWRFVQNAFMIF
ncbi:phospholipase A2 [Asbolus verrucosus]|uniref:Phospholipase A2 n=1 Tax=Asbolus verrucosus TaxID=1661398 RepID=A0A482VKX6_ASBVE|nr:phospholipase A2 [Asbolus verrucosus]